MKTCLSLVILVCTFSFNSFADCVVKDTDGNERLAVVGNEVVTPFNEVLFKLGPDKDDLQAQYQRIYAHKWKGRWMAGTYLVVRQSDVFSMVSDSTFLTWDGTGRIFAKTPIAIGTVTGIGDSTCSSDQVGLGAFALWFLKNGDESN